MSDRLVRAYPLLDGGQLYDYAAREDFAILNAVPTAEGAVELAMQHYEGTVFGSRSLVVGFGRIGRLLAKMLHALGSDVTVSARKPSDFAYIEALGYAGVVSEVTIVGTHLTTIDNRKVILPNGALSSGNIVNYSSFPLRRIDLPVSVEYGTDAAACKEALLRIIREDGRILDASAPGAADPFVAVQKLDSSSVNFIVRVWVKGSDYWSAWFDLNERIYTELPRAGIQFPFPQLDVHLRTMGK